MPDEHLSPNELFRSALQKTDNCPPIEALERVLDGAGLETVAHVQSCAFCSAELEMLQSFRLAEVPAEDAQAVRAITQRLNRRTARDFQRVAAPRRPWWQFGPAWLQPAALAGAAALVVIAIAVQFHPAGPPALGSPGAAGPEVFRSQTLNILSPSGDLQRPPEQARWEPAPSAATYRVRLLEVDGHELWSAQTANAAIAFPQSIQRYMVPAKTLLLVVTAFDSAGKTIAESESIRFRVLQNLYPR